MVMIHDRGLRGPGTHALIIGVGGYPLVPEVPPQSASRSAAMFATWMRRRFRNPAAPLASIDWIFLDLFQIERAKQLTDIPLTFVPPVKTQVIRDAVANWRDRLGARPGSNGIFFFSGHAVTFEEDTALLLQDFDPRSGNGGATSLLALQQELAELDSNLLFLIDAGRPRYSGRLQYSTPDPQASPGFRGRATIHATPPGRPANYDRNGTSLFAQALMANLEANSGRGSAKITPLELIRGINEALPAMPPQFAVAEGDLEFPFLDASVEGSHSPTDWQALASGPSMPPPLSAMDAVAPNLPSPQAEASPGPAALVASDVATAAPHISSAELNPRGSGDAQGGAQPRPGEPDEVVILDETLLDGGPVAPSPPPAGLGSKDDESNTEFVPDDAETERDLLGRSVLAIGLGRRLHRIWRNANEKPSSSGVGDERAAFVVHLDAPWGGGKTTFANYLGHVLDPAPAGAQPAKFLLDRYGDADLGGIFLEDPPADEAARERLAKLPPEVRRPWIVVDFNAWQVEHCAPPWWVFYQAIRKGCFEAVRKDGDLPWRPGKGSARLPWLQRMHLSAKLWLHEIGWRMSNPKIRSLLLTAFVSFALLLLLHRFGIWGLTGGKDPKTGYLFTSGFGLALGGVTTISFLWGLGALFTESIVPGTDNLAERLSLGGGDPFDRFRRHFARTIGRVRRPVMVVVDDLDRCRPDFVVGLVRGIQTLLRSPRVVFVILGDRDWIERAFEAHHKAMEKVDVGPEQSFGARFVEKAIQMSFILPAMSKDSRLAYVRGVLLGTAPGLAAGATAGMRADTARAVREAVNREAAAPEADPFDTQRIVERALEEVGPRPEGSTDEAELHRQVERLVGETLAINASSSDRIEQAVAHQLEKLAGHFPANPRQIKRIVNAITIYYAVALQRPGLDADETFRTQLALWIILMTEWPETWRLLASFPALVPILQSQDPIAALAADKTDLPGSAEARISVVQRILADAELTALIRGRDSAPALDPGRISLLAELTPLHSRKRRLPESQAAQPDDKASAKS